MLSTGDLLTSTLPDFWLGLDQDVDGETVEDMIGAGAQNEDHPVPRVLQHFHDPTWSSWSLSGLFNGSFPSSVHWQQWPSDYARQWPTARELYRRALTESNPEERARLFRKTFLSIGHIIHLIQDAATPAHTRDDQHLRVDRFHDWAVGEIAVTETRFTGNLSTATSDSLASRPVARIIDATEGDRGAAAWTTDIGLAEYSNLQFVSDDQTFEAYDRPDLAAMEIINAGYAGTAPASQRRYLRFKSSSGQGETDYYVAAQTPTWRRSPGPIFQTVLDDRVLSDYGRKLLPRAVGYSATAIDHFFRGRIEISAPDRFVIGRVAYEEGNSSSFETLRFKVRNASPAGQETTGEGTLWAVVHYRTSDTNVFENPGNGTLSEPQYAVSAPVEIGLTRSPEEVRFDFPDGGIPANSADVWLILVYQGELGGEEDAVLVGGKDLPEPQPIDFANLTDYDCANGQFLYVGNLAPNDPARDAVSGYHMIGPALQRQQYRKVSDGSGSPSYPSSTFFDFFVFESRIFGGASIADGQTPWSRFVVLQDSDLIWRLERSELRDENDVVVVPNDLYGFGTFARRNDYRRDPDGSLVRRSPGLITHRGWTGYNMVYMASTGVIGCGITQLNEALPDLTRIPGTVAPEE